jgi:CheY-like chemotaxis protein
LRVLLVEDNPLVAYSLAAVLRAKGHHVEVAPSGEGALEAMTSPPPHLALVDIGLPGIDGYEVARRFRARDEWRDVVLAALTGASDDDSRRQAEEAGFVWHLVKPVRFEELEQLLSVARQRAT